MAFSAEPLLGGELFDSAARFAESADLRMAHLTDPVARATMRERFWQETLGLGWAGVVIPEELDGAGGGLLDLAAILEGCGRFALPVPALAAFGVAPFLIDSLGGIRRRPILKEIANSRMLICPVLELLDGPQSLARSKANALTKADGNLIILEGDILGVEAIPGATHYLLACQVSGESALYLLPAKTAGVGTTARLRMDGRASVDIHFDAVTLDPQWALAAGDNVRIEVERTRDEAAVLASVEIVAAMGALLEQTISYLSQREQFGVKLSSLQVLRHYVADMYAAYANLRALVVHVIEIIARDGDPPLEGTSLVKLRLSDVSRFVAHTAIQVHGGMGITEELQAARLAKRILMADFEYGDGIFHAERLLASRTG
jgi:alkylation response protein AidB-like acyl-CoA dehydrogenase